MFNYTIWQRSWPGNAHILTKVETSNKIFVISTSSTLYRWTLKCSTTQKSSSMTISQVDFAGKGRLLIGSNSSTKSSARRWITSSSLSFPRWLELSWGGSTVTPWITSSSTSCAIRSPTSTKSSNRNSRARKPSERRSSSVNSSNWQATGRQTWRRQWARSGRQSKLAWSKTHLASESRPAASSRELPSSE